MLGRRETRTDTTAFLRLLHVLPSRAGGRFLPRSRPEKATLWVCTVGREPIVGAFFDALDRRWERPEIWQRLEKAIAVPPEFTEVVYVYRNLTNRRPVEYKEMLLSDLHARFGNFPLPRYLKPDLLRRIFGG